MFSSSYSIHSLIQFLVTRILFLATKNKTMGASWLQIFELSPAVTIQVTSQYFILCKLMTPDLTKLKKNILLRHDKFYSSGWMSALWVSVAHGQNLLISDERTRASFLHWSKYFKITRQQCPAMNLQSTVKPRLSRLVSLVPCISWILIKCDVEKLKRLQLRQVKCTPQVN